MRVYLKFIIPLAVLFLQAGCWLSYSWEDYRPLVSVKVEERASVYEGEFTPIHWGGHVLALRVNWNAESPHRVDLLLRGEITCEYDDGTIRRLPFKNNISGNCWAPALPFDLKFQSFDIAKKGDIDLCRVKFNVCLEGDIGGLLKLDPNTCIIVRFDESE